MEKIIKNSFLSILIVLIVMYSIIIPLAIIFSDNVQILSLLQIFNLVIMFSIVVFILIILLYVVMNKSTKLIKIEKNLLLGYIGVNFMFIFVMLFLYLCNVSNIFQGSVLLYAIIGMVYVIFCGLFIIVLTSIRMKKNITKIHKKSKL